MVFDDDCRRPRYIKAKEPKRPSKAMQNRSKTAVQDPITGHYLTGILHFENSFEDSEKRRSLKRA
ncbi:MAG: hypothetical protein WAW52_05430 [Methanothrix sp.]